MTVTKPVKRRKQLAPLSREHHDALLFIWKVKQGLKNKTSIPIISSYVQWFWNTHLKEHFVQEEDFLLPYLANNEMGDQLKKEHETIQDLISREMYEPSINLLTKLLNDHIRFEERQLFPHIEKTVSVERLNEIFEQLGDHRQCKTKWSNEFWIGKQK
jgi:hemerythrin-like domain-containing protein